MSVQSQIDRLNAIKARIRTNLVAQGITVPEDSMLEDMAEQILSVAGENGKDYVLTEADKSEIAALVIEMLGGNPIFGIVDENNNIIVSGNLPDGTYSVKYEMEDGSKVSIGNLVLDTNVYYTVTNNLTNCTSNNSATQVIGGQSYSATITAKSGYELKSVSATMGGTAVSVSNGKINITNVTGNIVITAVAEEVQAAEPTNFFKSDETPAVYGRLGSDGTNRTDTPNSFATNYIPVQTGDIVTVEGCDIGGIISGTTTYNMGCYNSDKAKLFVEQSSTSNTYFTRDSYTNNTAQITVTGSDVAYLRFTCSYPGDSSKKVDVDGIIIKIKRNGAWL